MAKRVMKVQVVDSPSPVSKEQDDWRAQSDFDTLERAEEVRSDKGRLSRAVAIGRKKQKASERVLRSCGHRSKARR